jgi:hypothetical protein
MRFCAGLKKNFAAASGNFLEEIRFVDEQDMVTKDLMYMESCEFFSKAALFTPQNNPSILPPQNQTVLWGGTTARRFFRIGARITYPDH